MVAIDCRQEARDLRPYPSVPPLRHRPHELARARSAMVAAGTSKIGKLPFIASPSPPPGGRRVRLGGNRARRRARRSSARGKAGSTATLHARAHAFARAELVTRRVEGCS